jgi:hypothetical protein
MVYMMTLPGGWIADRLIGQRRAVLYGGISSRSATSAWPSPRSRPSTSGLFLIVIGTGLLKGNVSVIVGQLYAQDDEPARCRLLDLLHGDQPRRVHRAAGVRLPRAGDQLASRVRRGGVGMRSGSSSTCSGAGTWATPGLYPAPPASPEAGER